MTGIGEPGLDQDGEGFRAASTCLAVDNRLGPGVQFAESLGQFAQGNDDGAWKSRDFDFGVFSNVEEDEIVRVLHASLEVMNSDFA